MTLSGHAHLGRHRCDIVACRDGACDAKKTFGVGILYGVRSTGQWNDFKLTPTITRRVAVCLGTHCNTGLKIECKLPTTAEVEVSPKCVSEWEAFCGFG